MTGHASRFARRVCAALAAGVVAACVAMLPAAAQERITVGVLKFGSVDWLVNTINANKLDAKHGVAVTAVPYATNNASLVSLLGRTSDVVVGDWFWVLRQRALGDDFVFAPYSISLGAVMVPKDSAITDIAGLRGKRLGVAGSPLDKGWLLLRAAGLKLTGLGDLADTAEPVYGAPPLLGEQLRSGKVDALLTYWQFAAGLEAEGYRRLTGVTELMTWLGKDSAVPLVGFILSQKAIAARPAAYDGFFAAIEDAKQLLLTSDAEWERLRPVMGAATDAIFIALRDRFREGLAYEWTATQRDNAGRIFDVLTALGGPELTGAGVRFDPAAFRLATAAGAPADMPPQR